MENLTVKISDLNALIANGRALEGFEKYYHEEVIMQENDSQPTIGKAANRIRESEFFDSVTEFRVAKPLRVTVGQNSTMVEWQFDYTHKEWGTRKYQQVSVQEWLDGRIIKEKFYYAQ